MAFTVNSPDHQLSPHTGMTRPHWRQAGGFLLDGALRHVPAPDQPIALPGEKPTPGGHGEMNLEALARTFMIAAPLIAEDDSLTVQGMNVRDYYAEQLLTALSPDSPHFVGHFDETARKRNRPLLGHTVEGAALAVGLWQAGEEIWDRYTPHQRNDIATWMSGVAHARTNSHNWRWFNALMLSYLETKGLSIERRVLLDHLENLLAYYAGDGWYRDGAQFDFYSCWAFQFYAPIWCAMYGYEHLPEHAAAFEANHRALQRTYPMVFSRDGHMPMWGRSIIYRCAAAVPLAGAFLMNGPEVDPGWARRICSGCMLQFITRDDVFVDGVPTLGFYGEFPAVVQGYSRPASPYWLAKLFLAMSLPADSSFWTAEENEGSWPAIGDGQRTGWQSHAGGTWDVVADALQALPTRPQIVRRTLPGRKTFRNVTVADIQPARRIVGTDRPVGIRVQVRNTGSLPVAVDEVRLELDRGRTLTANLPEIAPGAVATASFRHRFDRPGRHVLTARVSVEDDLPTDDTASRAMDVLDRLRVLVIDGEDGRGEVLSAGRYVAAALGRDLAADDAADDAVEEADWLIEPTVVAAPDVGEVHELDSYAMVILADVPRLPDSMATKLTEFVREGGGLLVAPGAWAEAEFYNNWT
ncbi:MAG: DUF2264 domain-containing protein, partial [Planctomycetota bacterium]